MWDRTLASADVASLCQQKTVSSILQFGHMLALRPRKIWGMTGYTRGVKTGICSSMLELKWLSTSTFHFLGIFLAQVKSPTENKKHYDYVNKVEGVRLCHHLAVCLGSLFGGHVRCVSRCTCTGRPATMQVFCCGVHDANRVVEHHFVMRNSFFKFSRIRRFASGTTLSAFSFTVCHFSSLDICMSTYFNAWPRTCASVVALHSALSSCVGGRQARLPIFATGVRLCSEGYRDCAPPSRCEENAGADCGATRESVE